MDAKIKQQTAIYTICCSILYIKKVAANRKIDCLMLDFQLSFDQQKSKELFVDGIFKKEKISKGRPCFTCHHLKQCIFTMDFARISS
jgi:hypothetical protein